MCQYLLQHLAGNPVKSKAEITAGAQQTAAEIILSGGLNQKHASCLWNL